MSKPYTLKHIQEHAIRLGGRCLSTEYKNMHEKLEFECDKGHKFLQRINHLLYNGTWCPVCSRKKRHTLETLREEADKYGWKVISKVYHNSWKQMEWRCPKGHEFERAYSQMRNRWFCPECNREEKLNQVKELAIQKGGECLSENYETVQSILQFRCKEGHIFPLEVKRLKEGTWCKVCKKMNKSMIYRRMINK